MHLINRLSYKFYNINHRIMYVGRTTHPMDIMGGHYSTCKYGVVFYVSLFYKLFLMLNLISILFNNKLFIVRVHLLFLHFPIRMPFTSVSIPLFHFNGLRQGQYLFNILILNRRRKWHLTKSICFSKIIVNTELFLSLMVIFQHEEKYIAYQSKGVISDLKNELNW